MQCLSQLPQHALHSKELLWCYIFPQVQLLFGSAPPFFWRIENFFGFGLMPWLIPASISFLFNKMLPTVAGDKLYFSAIAFLGVCKRLLWLLLLNVKAKAKPCAIVYLTCWSHSRSISALLQVSATGVLVRFFRHRWASKQHEDRCDRKSRSNFWPEKLKNTRHSFGGGARKRTQTSSHRISRNILWRLYSAILSLVGKQLFDKQLIP